jgi:hypothetical protein
MPLLGPGLTCDREALGPSPCSDLAFSRTCDPTTGEFGHAKLIRKFGDVLEDLSALRG